MANDHARVPQNEGATNDDFVLAELVLNPFLDLDVCSAIDFGRDASSVRQVPPDVEITPAPARFYANRLASRLRQVVSGTQSSEIDLAERVCPMSPTARAAQTGA
jgi:hypothetical protein